MKFLSTRNADLKISGRQAIVKGISDDGGLFVPEYFPVFDIGEIWIFHTQRWLRKSFLFI